MKAQQAVRPSNTWRISKATFLIAGALCIAAVAPRAEAAIGWDGQAGTPFWFDPVNWSFEAPGGTAPFYLPAAGGNPYQSTDANINAGPAGEGVVYDPLGADAANFAAAAGPDYLYPTLEDPRFDRDTIWRLYVSSGGASQNNKLTVKSGTLELIDRAQTADSMGNITGGGSGGSFIVGRGGTTTGIQGWLVQEGGSVISNEVALDIGHFQTNVGNGFYEYRGGILEVSMTSDGGTRLGHGGSTGPAGNGKLIVHNSSQPGYLRTRTLTVGSGLGETGSSSNGSGTLEFHANSTGTRAIQVVDNLVINHQDDSAGLSGNKRSAVLKLVLDAAPQVNGGGVPIDLALIDVDSDANAVGNINGASDDVLDPFVGEDDIFYSDTWDNGGVPLTEGTTISAIFGNTRYDWTLSYNGTIVWADQNTSAIQSISANLVDPEDPARDVVLIGLGSEVIGPVGLPGDYNGDDVVDAVDYTVWRNNLNDLDETDLNNNGNGGGVTDSDYTWWKQHYGDTNPGAGGLAGGTIPEPTTFTLVLLTGLMLAFRHRPPIREV
jgi:hypothetical protein